MTTYHPISTGARQRGFALLVSLTFLVVLTVLAVGAMKISSMQERMAGNAQDRSIAFQAAERTLREAEGMMLGVAARDFTPSCTNGYCSSGSAPSYSDDSLWGGAKDVPAITVLSRSVDANSVLSATPRWRAELAGYVECSKGWLPAYRITVRAQGQSDDTRVFLQSVFSPNCVM